MSDKDRVFTTKNTSGGDWVLKFVRPSQQVLNKGELVYRTTFSRALREGVLTQAEADSILRERKIWTDASEDFAQNLRVVISELEKKLDDASLTNEQGKLVCNEIRKKRIELIRHNNVYTQIVDNTCETMASESRTQLFAAECVYDNKTGLRVYKDVEDFKSRLNEFSTQEAFREAMISSLEVAVGRDLPSDLTTEYAENKWLEQRGLVEGAAEVKAEEKPKKKRGRKKKTSSAS